MRRKLIVFLIALLIIPVACNKPAKTTQTVTPYAFPVPTKLPTIAPGVSQGTPNVPQAVQTESAPQITFVAPEPPQGWQSYTNELYGYKIFFPPEAEVATKGIERIPEGEIPEGVAYDAYAKDLERKLGKELCAIITYKTGFVAISAPTNAGYRYAPCAPTGVGAGELKAVSEQVVIGGQVYDANGREFLSEDGTVHDEIFSLVLPDKVQIAFGAAGISPEAYTAYLDEVKPLIRQIVESFDSTIPATFDWANYKPPAGIGAEGDLADSATFLADVTIPDGTVMEPGEKFVKTWRLLNSGESTWTKSFVLYFDSGEQMGADAEVPLPTEVPPGGVVDISVEMVAPEESGEYTGFWRLKDEFGNPFGVGEDRFGSIWVTILVVGGDEGDVTATPSGEGSTVVNATLAIDQAAYEGTCPVTLNFDGMIQSEGEGSFEYKFLAGSSTPGFEFSLPGAQKVTFNGDGTHNYPVNFSLVVESTVNGWARIEIIKPNQTQSNTVSFTVKCED